MDIFKSFAEILAIIVPVLISVWESASKTRKKIDAIEKKLDVHIKDDSDGYAKQARVRILRFSEECYRGEKHSENGFEDVLEDIGHYESYCKAHPEFPNNKCQAAMSYIKEQYEICLRTHDFLS